MYVECEPRHHRTRIATPATRATRRSGAAPDLLRSGTDKKGLPNWIAPGHDFSLVMTTNRAPLCHPRSCVERRTNSVGVEGNVTYKKGDRSNCSSIRRVSVLSDGEKVPLKLITNRLCTFCGAKNLAGRTAVRFRSFSAHIMHAVRRGPTPGTMWG